MVLEGCAEPQLGCCILLRGASLQELIRVKKVVKFMVLACYNWKLEKAFLGDIEAVLPEPGMTFDDDEEEIAKDNKEGSFSMNNDAGPNEKDTSVGESDIINDEEKDNSDNSEVFKDAVLSANDAKSNDSKDNDAKCNDLKDNDKKEPDDPLQRTKFVRKADSEKNFSCGVPIRDFSDPLRATLSVDDDVFLPKEEAKLQADTHSDRWSTDDVVLSMSPHTVIPAPYLETEAGRRCPLRRYFPQPLLPHAPHTPRALHRKMSRQQDSGPTLKRQRRGVLRRYSPHTPRALHRKMSRQQDSGPALK
ncbi:putative 1-phosphatidylinositol 3-phosphate 5-kinase, partial [Ostrinia furnacalis]|uniref:putative 1-phosphatidylinositol 3-phosphate 5-kinase n=1 Tax=Ostrinia furnacalis TaxID=93504 RepID=UPI00103CD33A